jgi:hypothetical protein
MDRRAIKGFAGVLAASPMSEKPRQVVQWFGGSFSTR